VSRSRLYQRVFLLNAAIFVIATVVLVVTPATVSFPVEATEAIVLVVGLTALLVVNAVVLRAAFAPLDRLTRLMRTVDPYRPGARLEVSGPKDVSELVTVFNDMLDRLESERQASGRRALAAQEGERRRVAQELHDEVGQLLTGVLVQLEALAQRAPTDIAAEMRMTQEAARQALDVISRVVRELRPEALEELGLGNALSALARRVQAQTGLEILTSIADGIGQLGPERELVVYRVAQESVTNAVRHAQATSVTIALERRGDCAVLSVRDDGVGLPDAQGDRFGIMGMRERALLIGATLTIEDGRPGVRVVLTVPLAKP
jgi:two-component system sensor histidine kinase UhpB